MLMDDFDDTFSRDTAQEGRRLGQKKNSLFFMLGMGALLLSCLALLGAVFLYFNANKTPANAVATDTANVLSAVGKLVDLPSDETPQVVPISDIALFQNQPFFARARVGDALIVFIKNHVAVLYSPENNKIINMSKISVVLPPSTALP